MRQQQKTRPKGISESERVAANFEYQMASGKALMLSSLLFGGLTVALVHYHIPPYQKFYWLDDLGKLAWIPSLSMAIAHLYGRWVCRRKGISLEKQEKSTWRRKTTEPMEKLTVFGIGSSFLMNRIAGALGTLLFVAFLGFVIWMGLYDGIAPRTGLPPLRYVLAVIFSSILLGGTFAIGVAGLLMSLAALRSAGELVRVDTEGVTWVRGGARHHVGWSKLARAEVTHTYNVKGELAKFEVRFFDNEQQPKGTISFGETRPASLSPSVASWSRELGDFARQLRDVFGTPR